ncbi:MAG: RNA-guided pseudouridylation complex pseudouridine synthase subunit Cbf5 [Methanocellales archaeon]|nr:RNA-guided pseudouridylation complex pseudouridine synthase subunit Cbf5 [Methanocellales archaeon]
MNLLFEKRETLAKASDTTDARYGCVPEKRNIEEHINKGVMNIDKTLGPTSHEVVAWVKEILHVSKAGHSGTLDPKVTGVLPIMLGDATKAVGALLTAGKEYICVMRLHRSTSKTKIMETCAEFVGTIYQRPPMKSAVKRQIRKRRIYYLEVLEIENKDVLFKVGCESGTYIRKLCHDIGEVLGTGAHMLELRRTKSGPFTEANLKTLHDLKDAYVLWKEDGIESHLRKIILPMESALEHLPKIVIRDTAVDAICHGADLAIPGILTVESDIKVEEPVTVFTLKGEAVCLGTAKMMSKQMLGAKSGIAVDTDRVLMEPGIYPKAWTHKTS